MSHAFRTISLARYLGAIILLAAAVAVACDGGNGEPVADQISDEDLAAMVLTQSDLTPELTSLTLQESSRFDTNETRLQEADDPEDEARDQETFDRLNGFDRQFSSPEVVLQGEGVLLIAAGATLFADSDGASGYLEDEVEDVERRVGQTDLGLLLEAADRFDVSEVGDEAVGLRTQASTAPEAEEPTRIYVTYVWFRQGRLIGDIAIARVDDADASAEALELATRLDERIRAVLQGEPTPSP
jgi:hypothetical protein